MFPAHLVAGVSALLLGLLSGAMLLIAVALVPFWRRLPPPEFLAWFTANARRIGGLMVPLGGGAAVAAVGAAILGRHLPSRALLTVAAACAAGIALITLAVNEPANRRFLTGRLGDDDSRRLLARWAAWHWFRVALGLIGFVAALRAVG